MTSAIPPSTPTRHIEIKASRLRVAYDDFVALHTESLDLRGNIISVIGHNGAGKSTFIKSILGLLKPSAGTLQTWNVEPGARYPLVPEQHMAFCPEIGAVFADIPVESYIKLWCRIKHRDGSYYKKHGARYLEALQIGPLLKKLGRELSKGQRRRVQTAIGFLVQPKLFLFDEPFDGLDVQKTSELADIIRQESATTSFIISSHRMDVVERLSDMLVVLKEGNFIAAGSVEEVCRNLCGRSALIGNIEDPAQVLDTLRTRYPNCFLSRIGTQVSITGTSFRLKGLQNAVAEAGARDAKIDEVPPSLVDAMNFHLKDMRSQGRPESNPS
ncbi:MAG: ABC transporter ATP-binding protein [Deltaproteobacteria bacterium]|nr:ABC transporter ATP-binding protein [Deltaproteobacteria bacterium]